MESMTRRKSATRAVILGQKVRGWRVRGYLLKRSLRGALFFLYAAEQPIVPFIVRVVYFHLPEVTDIGADVFVFGFKFTAIAEWT